MPALPPSLAPAPRAATDGCRRRPGAGPALAAVLVLVLAPACSGAEEQSEAGRRAPGGSSAPPATTDPGAARSRAVPTSLSLGEVVGRVPDRRRRAAVRAVRGVVDTWLDRAYAGGSWPRSDYSGAFVGFTPGAERQARRDLRLTTNSGISSRISEVTVLRREVTTDVLATDRRVRAVTARLRLVYRTAGEVRHRFVVRGRLHLTRQSGRWRIFAYDLAKGVA